jgi:hypothetical protein
VDIVAVDWSGARVGSQRHIWSAHVIGGVLTDLRSGRTRDQVTCDLIELKARCPDGVVVGLDFAFSFPAWFVRQRGHATVADLWDDVALQGESWLAACDPPFWGRPGRRRPELQAHLRRTEVDARVAGIGAKSVFQIGGAGAVGTGSLRGTPHLAALRRAGFSIWPFDPPSPWQVVEIYPRLLTGPVHKRNRDDRITYLDHAPWVVPERFVPDVHDSEDAFDAVVSALVMDRHAGELTSLRQSADPLTLLEGEVWVPRTMNP